MKNTMALPPCPARHCSGSSACILTCYGPSDRLPLAPEHVLNKCLVQPELSKPPDCLHKANEGHARCAPWGPPTRVTIEGRKVQHTNLYSGQCRQHP